MKHSSVEENNTNKPTRTSDIDPVQWTVVSQCGGPTCGQFFVTPRSDWDYISNLNEADNPSINHHRPKKHKIVGSSLPAERP